MTDWTAEIDKAARYGRGGKTLRPEDVLALLKRVEAEVRDETMRDVMEMADRFLERRWPDLGDRPSSPPAGVLELVQRLHSLEIHAALKKGTADE